MALANILDPISDQLNPLIWLHPGSEKPELKPRHAHFITKHIYHVLEAGGYSDPKRWAQLCLTGSLTTYQYGPHSDCDVSLFVDSQELPEWSRAEMIGLMIENFDGTVLLPGTPYPIQAYVVGKGIKPHDLYQKGLRSGYDITSGRWIEPPDHDRSHNVAEEENGFYTYALEQADKMESLLKYEPEKAVMFWHQLHRKRMRDEAAGKGDFSEANIIYKFLENRDLMPAIAQVSGEHIARSWDPLTCENCGHPMTEPTQIGNKWMNHCTNCGSYREVPSNYGPLVQQQAMEELSPYPDLLKSVQRERPWVYSAWDNHFLNQIEPIARAYHSLPEYDPRAASAWQELAEDSRQRANQLRQQYNITETDHPEPYANAQEMFNDINRGNFTVSRANIENPVWTPNQNINFRIVHDILGHHSSGGDFSWGGENKACGAHFPLLAPNAQQALMTECLGQTGYAIANGGFGPQKVGFMDHLLTPAQQENNQTFSSIPSGGFCHRHIRHGIYRL